MILVWAVGAAGSAAVLHTEGREFEPLTAYQTKFSIESSGVAQNGKRIAKNDIDGPTDRASERVWLLTRKRQGRYLEWEPMMQLPHEL